MPNLYLPEPVDYSSLRVAISLSGGINSAAVLCELGNHPVEYAPMELHLVYIHLREHSKDTFRFVADCMRWARKRFPNVLTRIYRHSVIDFFREKKFIPHPTLSPCTQELKISHLDTYDNDHFIDVKLIGWVREEFKRRMARASKYSNDNLLFQITSDKRYPIKHLENEWCFEIVREKIGWYPAIYDIRDADGNRVFNHNNCLPCKNMDAKGMANVKRYFPDEHQDAMELSRKLNRHWGRKSDNICHSCEF